MVGGYMSFAGKGCQARFSAAPLADVLPVEIATGDDRVGTPAGATPVTDGIPDSKLPDTWPEVLSYNRFTAAEDAEVWATVDGNPFLVVGGVGAGSAFASATDCAPHWAPTEFLEGKHVPVLWERILQHVTEGQ